MIHAPFHTNRHFKSSASLDDLVADLLKDLQFMGMNHQGDFIPILSADVKRKKVVFCEILPRRMVNAIKMCDE